MTYGFRIRGDSGVIQVDDQYSNLAVLATGTGSLTTRLGIQGGLWYGEVSFSTNGTYAPMIGLRAAGADGYFGLIGTSVNGNTWTWRIGGGTDSNIGGQGKPFNYWIFGRPAPIAGGGWGLRVNDANGRPTFDSNYRYARILRPYQTTVSDVIAAGGTSSPLNYDMGEPMIFVPGSIGVDTSIYRPNPSTYYYSNLYTLFRNSGTNVFQVRHGVAPGLEAGASPASLPSRAERVSALILAEP